MQSYKLVRSKVNSKACDQCYRCKAKCTMEQNGCARCRMSSGICTYSIGKRMGRPKKSSKTENIGPMQSAGSPTQEDYNSRPNHVLNLPEQQRHWGLFSPRMKDFSQLPSEGTTLSPFSIDDFGQPKAGDFLVTFVDSQDISASTSQIGALDKGTPQLGVTILDPALSPSFEQVNIDGHQNSLYHKHVQSRGSQQDFGLDSVGEYTALFPIASTPGAVEVCSLDYTMEPDKWQTSPTLQRTPSSREGGPCHCNCSLAALACLDKISTVPSEAQYTKLLETAQFAFSTTERLVLCITCKPSMIIAECCFILENAYEIMTHMSAQLGETTSNKVTIHQANEDVQRVKRRAAVLVAGLRTLIDPGPGNDSMSSVQSEILMGLARSWSSLLES